MALLESQIEEIKSVIADYSRDEDRYISVPLKKQMKRMKKKLNLKKFYKKRPQLDYKIQKIDLSDRSKTIE